MVRETSSDAVLGLLTPLWGAPLSDDEYGLLRVQNGYPAYPTEINDEIILTESKRADAVSFSKGCYVGQEVIERSDAIGKVPRHLERVVLNGQGSITSGDSIVGADGVGIGKVVTVFSDAPNNCIFLFALLRTGKYAVADTVRCGELTGTILSS